MIKIKHLLLFVLLAGACSMVSAQRSARISGTVSSDAEGPLIMVNITERDKSNRIIEACATDFEGNFSMVVKNTSNVLEISYIGYKTQRIEIGDRTVFNIKMVEDNVLTEVEIVAKSVSRSGGLDILEREMTHATQKISMDEMEGLSFASVDEALQGQIAGLDIVFNSGDVGSGTKMQMRGGDLLEGDSQPLIVVDDNILETPTDGFDFENATNESFAELLMVNPEDIAEIEVLKDAAACAAYGSKSGGAVIKIKTKRGKRGPTRVSFTYKFKDKWTPKGINLLNGDDYTMYIKQALFNYNQSPNFNDIWELNYDKTKPDYENYNNNSDWVDAVSKHGYRNEYNLNINGGGEKATFRIAGGYSTETGQVVGQFTQNYSSRLALDYYVSERIKVIADFSFSYFKRKTNSGILSDAQLMMPNMSIYKQDDKGRDTSEFHNMIDYQNKNEFERNAYGRTNPLARAYLAEYKTEEYRINPQITLEYSLLGLEDNETQLKYRGMVHLSASTSSGTTFNPASLSMGSWTDPGKNYSESNDNKSLGFTTRHQLIFTPYLGNKDHYLTMNSQFEMRTGSGNSQNSRAVGLPTGNITSSTIGSKLKNTGTGKWDSRNLSFTYDAHYSYKSKYSLRLTLHAEGNTAMGDDQKWSIYPAISGRWNLIDESWMERVRGFMPMLSLRGGFGITGYAPGESTYFNSYSEFGQSYLGMAGYKMDGIRLTALRRSEKREWNVGTDIEIFKGMIRGAFNYYSGTTYDQLIGHYKIPSSTGFESLRYKNSGTVRNRGWEVNLNSGNIKLYKDLSMTMYFNIGKNYNEILEIEDAYLAEKNQDGQYENPRPGGYLPRYQLNNPCGAIYGFRYKGVYRYSYKNWQKALAEEAAGRNGTCPIARDANGNVIYGADGTPKRMSLFFNTENQESYNRYEFRGGDAIYEDINHDGTINQLDIVYLGNSNPVAQGGFGFNFKYKNFGLRTSFTYRWDVDIVNSARMDFEKMDNFNNQSYAVNWRWRKEGDITEIPRAMYGTTYNYLGSDRFVEDASYLRLSYVQLSYSFDAELLKKIGLRSLTLYASADNVYHWTKYSGLDPEIPTGDQGIAFDNSKTPRPRSYTISVSVGF